MGWSRTVQFEPVVRKLSQFFVNLEKESVLLSSTEDHNDGEKVIERMLEQVYNDLNSEAARCVVECGQNSLQLCVANTGHDPAPVYPHHVPILTQPHTKFCPDQWDLTTTQILPHIDGFYHNVVGLTSIFQYSNVYTVTPALAQLRSEQQFRQDLMTTITRREGLVTPSFRDVYTFISSFTYGTTVRDLCQRMSPAKLGFDECRLVQYCVMRAVLRRVHKFPVWTGDNGDTGGDNKLTAWMTGEFNTDQICVAAGVSSAHLDKKIDEDSSVIVI